LQKVVDQRELSLHVRRRPVGGHDVLLVAHVQPLDVVAAPGGPAFAGRARPRVGGACRRTWCGVQVLPPSASARRSMPPRECGPRAQIEERVGRGGRRGCLASAWNGSVVLERRVFGAGERRQRGCRRCPAAPRARSRTRPLRDRALEELPRVRRRTFAGDRGGRSGDSRASRPAGVSSIACRMASGVRTGRVGFEATRQNGGLDGLSRLRSCSRRPPSRRRRRS
jgi:hypothetical protein